MKLYEEKKKKAGSKEGGFSSQGSVQSDAIRVILQEHTQGTPARSHRGY